MSSDDLTHNKEKPDQDDKDTQPTITAVFRLLQDVESRQNARLDAAEARLNARIDGVESRLAGDIDGLNTRMIEGFKELSHKIKRPESKSAPIGSGLRGFVGAGRTPGV
jgi:hypothetical protein